MSKIQIKQTMLDKFIGHLSPGHGLKRLRARAGLALAESYTGASRRRNSMKEWIGSTGDADADLQYDRDTLITRSRDLVRNDPIASGACGTTVLNVVGSGLRPRPKIDYDFLGLSEEEQAAWERQAIREFNLWAESTDCDVERTLNFYQKQELTLRQVFENGDVFTLLPRIKRGDNPYYLKLQTIEADRVFNQNRRSNGLLDNGNKLFDGVEKDRFGAPVKYHICRRHPGSVVAGEKYEWDVVDAFAKTSGLRNVIHNFIQLRPGQSRGVPHLAAVLLPLKQLSKYTGNELAAAVVAGLFTVFIKTESGETELAGGTDNKISSSESETGTDDYRLGNGAVIGLAENESIETANPGRPNTAYDPFVNSLFKQIGVGIGIPYEVLMKAYESSYSAARAALLDAWRFFKQRRKWLADTYCQVIYEVWMWEAVAMGRISAPGFFADPLIRKAYLGVEWVGPTQGQLDPVKEIDAAERRVGLKVSTIERETMEYSGEDFESNKPQIRREAMFLKEIGQTKNNQPTQQPKDGEE